VFNLAKPINGIIAEDLSEELGYFINTRIKKEACILVYRFETNADILDICYNLILYKHLKINIVDLINLLPEYQFSEKLLNKINTLKRADKLNLI
jgi:hypothetical protein